MKIFFGFLAQNKLLYIGFLLILVTEYVLFALNPYFYKLFVDAIPALNYQELTKILLLYLVVRIIAMVLDLAVGFLGDKLIFNAATDSRVKIFKKVQDLDFAFHLQKSTGSLISAFKRGDAAVFSFFHDIHYRLVSVFVGFFVMFYFFIQLGWQITAIISASFLVTMISARFLVGYNVKKRKVFNDREDDISAIITDNLINFETVKLFAKEKWEESRLIKDFVPWLKALWGYGNSFRLIDFTMGTIINISIFLILYYTVVKTIAGDITVGQFVLIASFLSNFFPKLWELVWGSRDLAKNYVDIEKYYELLSFETEVKDPANPQKLINPKGEIVFKDVYYSYKEGTKNAVKKFNLTVKPGESVALVGKSGSGKTTITKLLMRFFDVEKGKITIDGIDIRSFNKDYLREMFGIVPQEPILFNNTVEYNIGYGAEKYSTQEVKRAAKLANIHEFIENLPKKYDTNVGERGVKLSGGQKQRLAIARMIMSKPLVIIFDEATSHLDSESEKLIQEAFWNEAKGKTTIVVAHRLSTIAKADRIVVMEKGEIKEIGKHKDLLENKNSLYKRFWDIQVKQD